MCLTDIFQVSVTLLFAGRDCGGLACGGGGGGPCYLGLAMCGCVPEYWPKQVC